MYTVKLTLTVLLETPCNYKVVTLRYLYTFFNLQGLRKDTQCSVSRINKSQGMRDPCRCLQAFILKALNMQWGHIYLEVAAAQDNNIPLHLGVIKCAAEGETGWTCRNTPVTSSSNIDWRRKRLSTCWHITCRFLGPCEEPGEPGEKLHRRNRSESNLQPALKNHWGLNIEETWRFQNWMSLRCQKSRNWVKHSPTCWPIIYWYITSHTHLFSIVKVKWWM